MKKNWMLFLFFAAFAALTFSGCSDDDNSDVPENTHLVSKEVQAAQNGKTGVPTGSLSDNHIFLVRSQTNLYIIEYKQVCTQRSIAPVYKKQYAQSSRTNLWLLLAYKRKFFG
jgi:hypothetical protein